MKKTLVILLCSCLLNQYAKAQVVYGQDEKNYIFSTSISTSHLKGSDNISIPNLQDKGYLHYKPSNLGDNWFLSLRGGFSSFINSPITSTDFYGRTKEVFDLSIGKWHSPYIGNRLVFQGFKFIDFDKQNKSYQSYHTDLLFNISSLFRHEFESLYKWNLSPFVGVGVVNNPTLKYTPFAISYGVNLSYMCDSRLSITAEVGNTTTSKGFDGYGDPDKLGDHFLKATIGVTYNIGSLGWQKKKSRHTITNESEKLNIEYPEVAKEDRNNKNSGLNALRERLNKETSEETSSSIDEGIIGTPVYFFFKFNSTEFTNKNQFINLKELAQLIKKDNLYAKILGSADNKTGTEKYNRKLSIKRAKYIMRILQKYGIPKEHLKGFSQGGVELYKPYTANRYTSVILYKQD